MSNPFMQYEHESGVIARWSGGSYIDLGWIDGAGEFHATDTINVYDYAKGEPEIRTFDDMRAEVDEHLHQPQTHKVEILVTLTMEEMDGTPDASAEIAQEIIEGLIHKHYDNEADVAILDAQEVEA